MPTYINDSITLSLNGPEKIKSGLIEHKIDGNIIKKYISKIDDETWKDRIKRILNKKSKINKTSISIFKQKMYSYLIGLGYQSNMIKELLDEYRLDDSTAFIKEADKIYDKVSKKYKGIEIELYFKNKMYQKGYGTDKINEYLRQKN